jgi:peptidoglycan/xylan/chitin deacetylase (PgdA/CDA1 family)
MNPAPLFITGSLFSTAAAGCIWEMARPTSQFCGPVYYRGDPKLGPRYALTFDDGPTDPSTAAILDILGQCNARATFFVIGNNVSRFPRLIERMHAEGHLVGNHSLDHDNLCMWRGPTYWRRQIERTDALIEQIICRRPRLFRPPMGVKTWFINPIAYNRGHTIVTWSRRGFDGVRATRESILGRLVGTVSAGDIVLLHDGVKPGRRRDPSGTVEAVRPLIQQLRDRGFEPARLDELLPLEPYASVPEARVAAERG